jgi:hypothetical protein
MSKIFTIMTTMKTKLGNNFPTDALEDRILTLSVLNLVSDKFKVCREGRTVFYKWMDNMFEEYSK